MKHLLVSAIGVVLGFVLATQAGFAQDEQIIAAKAAIRASRESVTSIKLKVTRKETKSVSWEKFKEISGQIALRDSVEEFAYDGQLRYHKGVSTIYTDGTDRKIHVIPDASPEQLAALDKYYDDHPEEAICLNGESHRENSITVFDGEHYMKKWPVEQSAHAGGSLMLGSRMPVSQPLDCELLNLIGWFLSNPTVSAAKNQQSRKNFPPYLFTEKRFMTTDTKSENHALVLLHTFKADDDEYLDKWVLDRDHGYLIREWTITNVKSGQLLSQLTTTGEIQMTDQAWLPKQLVLNTYDPGADGAFRDVPCHICTYTVDEAIANSVDPALFSSPFQRGQAINDYTGPSKAIRPHPVIRIVD